MDMKTDSDRAGTIDEYIASQPPEVQAILQEIRRRIRALVPEARETIKYRIPTFVLNENLVHFAAFRNHIGFYPTASGISAFKDQLEAYPNAKGSVQFPLSRPIPYSLIERIVRYRAKEVRTRPKCPKTRGT